MYKLLIADDELLEHEAIRFFIENSKLDIGEIFSCVNGMTAVQTAMMEKPDIIILDIKMPVLSGLEAMERIISTNKNCKIIFSTAYNYFEYAVKAMQLGAIDYIVKPVKEDVLIHVLNKAIDLLDAERARVNNDILLDEVMQILGNKVLDKILTEDIDEEVLYYLDLIGADNGTGGHAFLIQMQEQLSHEKQQHMIKTIKEDLEFAKYKCIVNLKNLDLRIIVFSSETELRKNVVEKIKLIISSVFRDVKIDYKWNEGNVFEDLSEISQLFMHTNIKQGDEPIDINNLPISKQEMPKEIQDVCSYIQLKYMEKITLDTLAETVGFSKYHLSRLFKHYKKMTIVDYLTQTRINKAKELLKAGGYSIKQISFMIGYSDPNYFTWAFKKSEGVSPVKYRY